MPAPAATGNDFSERLDLALKALNLSRAQLAALVGVDKSMVSRWLSGHMRPTGHNLSRISEALAKVRPGFNTLLWERPRGEFEAFLGIAPPPEAARPESPAPAPAAPPAKPGRPAPWLGLGLGLAAVLLMAAGAAAFWPRTPKPAEATAPAGANVSIAVMPFANLSGDSTREFFSDGFSVELLNTLANSPGLTVAPRTDSFAFRDGRTSTVEVARRLKVRYLLAGSVREDGDRIRVGVELIDAEKGRPVWSQQYDRHLTDVLKMQDEIARTVAAQLTHRLLPAAVARPVNPEVYRTYLQAQRYIDAFTPEGMTRAIQLLEDVTRRQPDYADAWATLGVAHGNMADMDRRSSAHHLVQAESALRRSLALDPRQARALLYMIGLDVRLWRWDEAVRYERLLQATDAKPSLKRYGHGSVTDALAIFPQMRDDAAASTADGPDDPMVRYSYSWSLGVNSEYGKALEQTREGLVLLPNNLRLQGLQCFNLAMLGRMREASALEARLREAFRDRPIGDELGMCSGAIAHKAGDRVALRALADRMAREFPGEGGVQARSIGLYYQQALAFDEAMVWYRRAYELREYDLMQMPFLPAGILPGPSRRLFDDPRWKALWASPEIREWERTRKAFIARGR